MAWLSPVGLCPPPSALHNLMAPRVKAPETVPDSPVQWLNNPLPSSSQGLSLGRRLG
jgi:hypothetical protein